MKPYEWIWQYLKRYLGRYVLAMVLCGIVAMLSLVNPYVTGKIVGDVLEKGLTDKLTGLLIALIGVTVFRTVVRYIFLLIFEDTSQKIVYQLRQDVYRRIQDQDYLFYDSNRIGDIMARVTGDLDAIRGFIAFVVYALFENVIIFVAAIVMSFLISWQLTLLMLLVAPVLLVITYRQSKEIRPAFSAIREQFSKLNSVCEENISGNRVVKAFTREPFEERKFTSENQAYYDANYKAAMVRVKYLPFLEFLTGLLTVFLILVGGIMVIWGKMELWQLVTVNGYLWAISNPMRMFGWLVNDVQGFNASLDKIAAMMRKKIHIFNPENPKKPEHIYGDIEFDNVSFSYDPNDPKALVLKNISFSVPRGSTVGVVGATGSGKTTLTLLLSRFYDVTQGSVKIDGVDVREYDLLTLRKYISSAAQDVFLFSDTVEGNIAYGVPEAPMEHINEMARVADAHDFIQKLSEGYDTIVGERGVGLSGGQKQRLSLARALADDPSIIILDDTTSAVDMETEHRIQQSLKDKYADKTAFIIAHRISSVKPADIILVLEDGRIIERGNHNELLAQKGYYYDLFQNQYGEYEQYKQGGELLGA